MEALNKQALRILRLFGNDAVKRVYTSVGPEQEYFLIDKEMYDRRPDLRYTGRTPVSYTHLDVYKRQAYANVT